MEQFVPRELHHQHRNIGGGNRRPHDIEEMQQLLARPDHQTEEGNLPQRRAQASDFLAELAAIEGLSHDRASARHAARRVAMVVGKGRP